MPANRCPNPSCEYFNRTLPNNAKVCPWCSTPLGNVVTPTPSNPNTQPNQPPPLPEQPNYQNPIDYSTQYQQRAFYPPQTQPIYTPPSQRLPALRLIHNSGREFRLPGEAGYIGRRSQTVPVPPEIDLTGIPNEGVISRRHARIYWDWSQNSYMIVDMSTNGIYLNGNLLNSGAPYRLLNNDLLQLGQDSTVTFTVAMM